MELKNLICETNIIQKVNFDANIEVQDIFMESSKCTTNSLFFAINGTNTNGELYASNAVKNGAVVVVTEHKIDNLNVCQLIVDNQFECLSTDC